MENIVEEYKHAKKFSFDGQILPAYITKVYDGDTITASIHVLSSYYLFQVRIDGIDTPELKTGTEESKAKGKEAGEFVRNLILNKFVILRCKDFDKYGRLLADIETDAGNVAVLLLQKHEAVEYHGGKKSVF
jgi:endonuclease YncB( thermonuclease family)